MFFFFGILFGTIMISLVQAVCRTGRLSLTPGLLSPVTRLSADMLSLGRLSLITRHSADMISHLLSRAPSGRPRRRRPRRSWRRRRPCWLAPP